MNPFASEPQGEMVQADRSAAPAAIRYPQSAVRYPLLSLQESNSKPASSGRRASLAMARPRRMMRSAPGLLWWVPFWYVLGQFALFAWIDDSWAFARTRVEHDKWKQLHERLAAAPDSPLVLMLGSSRSDWAFQAGRLSGQPGPDGRPLLAYNFGVPTTGPLHEALYLNDLLREGVRPRLVLVEFVTTLLNQSQRGLQSEEHFTTAEWLSGHQMLFFRSYYSNKRQLTSRWLEARLAPWYGYRCAVHDHLRGEHSQRNPCEQANQPMDEWGCRMLFADPGTPEFRIWRWASAVGMYAESLQRFRLGAGPVQALRDVLERCRRERVPVALVRMPITQQFQALISAEGRAELDNLFAELSAEVPVIDASDWLAKEDFDDGHHVLAAGAYKFTTRMIDEVHKLLARTQPPG